jgi:glycosyltransferase involved in cell wall biosynthesis
VASLEAVKGHRYLIEACRILKERGIDFHCELVGDGPLRQDLERQIARSGLGGRVRLLGGQPRARVAQLLANAHAAALASHPTKDGKREGIPVALMEAMSAGLPVVATAISGIPELVQSEVTGLLVPSGDPVALADALERLTTDRALCERLGRAARSKVMRAFSLRASAATLLGLITGAPLRQHNRTGGRRVLAENRRFG